MKKLGLILLVFGVGFLSSEIFLPLTVKYIDASWGTTSVLGAFARVYTELNGSDTVMGIAAEKLSIYQNKYGVLRIILPIKRRSQAYSKFIIKIFQADSSYMEIVRRCDWDYAAKQNLDSLFPAFYNKITADYRDNWRVAFEGRYWFDEGYNVIKKAVRMEIWAYSMLQSESEFEGPKEYLTGPFIFKKKDLIELSKVADYEF